MSDRSDPCRSWRTGGRGSIARIREVLADQLRADHLAVALDQAAVRLMREKKLRKPGHSEGIGKPVISVRTTIMTMAGWICLNMMLS